MKKTFKKITNLLLVSVMAASISACGQKDSAQNNSKETTIETTAAAEAVTEAAQAAGTTEVAAPVSDADVDGELIVDHEEELQYASKFTLTHYKGGYKMFTIPEAMGEKEYLIVPEGKSVPADLSDHTVVLQQPVDKIASAVTAGISLIDQINGLDSIVAVATEYEDWYLENVSARMEAGEIQYMGSYSEPDFELLMDLGTQVEFDSAMILNKPEIMDKYEELGIPCIVDYSSKEEHLLGRIEWIKLYGALLGLSDEADQYFESQVEKVDTVSNLEKTGKTAVMYYKSKDTYYLRNAGDYVVSMLTLAGGETIAPEVGAGKGGSTKMNAEEFYATCKDADYIFQVVFECPYNTIEEMIEYDELFADFKAVKEGNVYTTIPGFSQSSAILADVVVEINSVLNDPSIEATQNLIKIQ